MRRQLITSGFFTADFRAKYLSNRRKATRQSGKRSRVETLEPRVYMTANTVVGDASFVLYDGNETATVETDFDRPIATVDPRGNPVAADEQRYGETATYAAPVQWEDSGVALPVTNLARVIASGWDFDGETPVMIYHDETRNRLVFYRGDNLSIVNNRLLVGNDLMNGTVAGERYIPRAAIIHHGLIVVGTARSKLIDGSWKTVGVEFFTTQDYGVSFERVPVVGGGDGLPIFEPAVGLDRLQRWSFQNPFPVNGIDDVNSIWLPWTDYLYKAGFPKGGQVGLFRADRAPGETHWTISPNRVVYSQWVTEDTGGLHAHTAAVTIGGLISHWGDVSYRSQTLFHKFDLDNYQTAPVTTTFAFGGYNPTVGSEQGAPQPVAAAPSPVFGEHIAGGDETPDHILTFGPMTDSTDRLQVTSTVYKPELGAPGGVYGGAAVLHLQWLQNVGYAAAAGEDDFYYYSPDGKHWARITLPTSKAGAVWLYGDRLLSIADGRFWLAELPTVETVQPLSISPGGANLIASTLDVRTNPGAGNTARRVVYQDGAWRYADTLVALATQAAAPPFLSDAPVYEVTMGDEDFVAGVWWLQPPGATSPWSLPHVTEAWVANLGSQEIRVGSYHAVSSVPAGQNAAGSARYYQINDNTQWTATGVSLDTTSPVNGRYAFALRTLYKSPGAHFLVALPYFGESPAPTYPMSPQSSGPDEVGTASLGSLSNAWTAGFVARWPENARQHGESTVPIASLVGPTGDAVVWAVRQRNVGTRLSVDVYKAGVLTATQYYDTKLLRGDVFETVVSSSGDKLTITFRPDGQQSVTFELPAVAGLQLDKFQWAGRDGDVVTGIDAMLVVVDKDMAWTAAEHKQWTASSLSQKAVFNALPAPGDFNSDGVVDMADFEVWEATHETPVFGRAGDANGDGYVDAADAQVWRQQYGSVGSGLAADFNNDGVVNAADYTIWRDSLGSSMVTPGSGADANRDGHVRSDDLVIWAENLGRTYSSLEELRNPTPPSPPAAVVSSENERVDESVGETSNEATPLAFLIAPASSDSSSVLAVMKASWRLQVSGAQHRLAMLTLDAALATPGGGEATASTEWSDTGRTAGQPVLDEAFASSEVGANVSIHLSDEELGVL